MTKRTEMVEPAADAWPKESERFDLPADEQLALTAALALAAAAAAAA